MALNVKEGGGCLSSCPNGEGGSISKSYCDTGRLGPLMSSQQQAAGAEERRPEGFQRGDLVCPDGVSIH